LIGLGIDVDCGAWASRKITDELSLEGVLVATIGQLKGGTPRRFEFRRESSVAAEQSAETRAN